MSVFDEGNYPEWRRNRVKALINRFGHGWFAGKRVILVGDGQGHVGRMIQDLGADVVSTEAREAHVRDALAAGSKCAALYNAEDPWPEVGASADRVHQEAARAMAGRFDLAINWGLVYHCIDQRAALQCVLHADHTCLETEVWNSLDPKEFRDHGEAGPDQAASPHSTGRWSTAETIESLLYELGCVYERDLSGEANTGERLYNWKLGDQIGCPRRWWWIRRPAK